MSIIPSWQLHEPIIDLVFGEADTIFAVCKNGLYELPIKDKIIAKEHSNFPSSEELIEPCQFSLSPEPEVIRIDESDEEVLYGTPRKKPCVTSSRIKRAEIFRVKYDNPILCCCQNGSTLYTLHSKDERQNFVKSTDLKTFKCDSNVVCVISGEKITENDKSDSDLLWMTFDKSRIFVHCFGKIYLCTVGPTNGEKLTEQHLVKLLPFSSKLQLFSEHEIQRPEGSIYSDLIEQIIDSQEVNIKKDKYSNIICPKDIVDLAFMNNDTLLLLSNQGQLLKYSKSHGRELEKTEYPIAHVKSFILTQQTNNVVVLTKYGAIYRIVVTETGPKSIQKHHDQDPAPGPTKDFFKGLLKAANELEELNAERVKLEEELKQLNICLSGTLRFMINEITVTGNNKSNELEFNIVNESDNCTTLYGKYWRLCVSICSTVEQQSGMCMTYPLPMGKFGRNMTWRVKVPVVPEHVQISNLPLKVTIYFLFMNNEISLASHWSHSFNLDSLDFLRIKSSLVQQKSEGAQGMNNANNQHEDNLELVDFVDYINAKRLFNQCSLNEQKHKKILSSGDGDDTNTMTSIIFAVNLSVFTKNSACDFSKLVKEMPADCQDEKNVYVELFDVPMTLTVKKSTNYMKIRVTGRHISHMIQFKKDLLYKMKDPGHKIVEKCDDNAKSKLDYLLHSLKNCQNEDEEQVITDCYDKLRKMTSKIE